MALPGRKSLVPDSAPGIGQVPTCIVLDKGNIDMASSVANFSEAYCMG